MPLELKLWLVLFPLFLLCCLPGVLAEDKLDREGWERWKCPHACGPKCPLCHPRSR